MIQLKVQNHQNTFEATLTIIFHGLSFQMLQKNAKTRKNLEASYNALWKPDLNEQKDFERLVSHGAINDIMQTSKKKVSSFFLLFSLLYCF